MLTKSKNDFPQVTAGKKILIIGASGGVGLALVKALLGQELTIGAHYASPKGELENLAKEYNNLELFEKYLCSEKDCLEVVEEFNTRAGGLDALVVCTGGITNPVHWRELKEEEWEKDLFINLSAPFYLSRAVMQKMKKGGRIVLFSTESALHGGSSTSLAYGVAKMGIECLTKGLAREGAKDNILVNCIRPAFIASGFHERWQHKEDADLAKRIEIIPLKRAGTPDEVAALALYLLSSWGDYITGQSFAITGGDWL